MLAYDFALGARCPDCQDSVMNRLHRNSDGTFSALCCGLRWMLVDGKFVPAWMIERAVAFLEKQR